MIARVRGNVAAVEPDALVIDVQGVGYRVFVPGALLGGGVAPGNPVDLHTHLHVRDSELTLYGAADAEALRLFEMLLSVSGVGPKVALAVLSAMDAPTVLSCVEGEDIDRLTAVPGVGKKTAQRMILDLKGKLPALEGAASDPVRDEALLALTGLGYTPAEARAALDAVDPEGTLDLEERVRDALRELAAA